MGQFVNLIRKKLGLEPKRETTVTGKTPNEVIINRQMQEAAGSTNPVVFAPARMNPPTPAHRLIIDTVKKEAARLNAPHHVVLTRTHDVVKKKRGAEVRNPLTPEQKIKHARRFFPDANVQLADKSRPNLLSQLSDLHQRGHDHVVMVAGSDRIPEYKRLIDTYNGKSGPHGHFNFKKVEFKSAGERDPEAEGAAGWSATKSRQTAEAGNFAHFKKNAVPGHVSDAHAKELHDELRGGMGLSEAWNPFKKKDSRPAVEHPKERFPDKHKANEWMSQKVAHYARHKPNELHHLFSPASGDYMPKDVHVGSSWKKEHEDHYNELKKQHPEAVKKAKEMTTGIAGRVSLSRVGPHADFHGMSIHNEDVGFNMAGGLVPAIPTKAARDIQGKKSPLTDTPPPGKAGNLGYDSDLDKESDHNKTELSRRRAKKRLIHLGVLEGTDGSSDMDASPTVYPVTTTPVPSSRPKLKSFRQMSEGQFTDVPGEQGSPNYGSDVDNSSSDAVSFKKKKIKEDVEHLMERGADSKGLKRPTELGAGLTRKGAKAAGVKTAVTTPPSKLDPNGKAAKRRKSFCARMGGMKGPMKDEKGRPTRKAMSLRRWNCEAAFDKNSQSKRFKKKFNQMRTIINESDDIRGDNDEDQGFRGDLLKRGTRVRITKDGYEGLGNIDHYDKTNRTYLVSVDKDGSNMFLQAGEVEPVKEETQIAELSGDLITSYRRGMEKDVAMNRKMDPAKRARREKGFATSTHKILGLAKVPAVAESKNKPYVKPHFGDLKNPTTQTGWKASNHHGKVKYFGKDFKKSAERHAYKGQSLVEQVKSIMGTEE